MTRKKILRTVSFLLTFILLPLCACSSQTSTPQPTGKKLSGLLTIYYIAPSNVADVYGPAIEEFKKLYPDVEVKTESYYDVAKLDERISSQDFSKEGPDLLLLNSDTSLDIQRMASAGKFMDLQPWLGQDSTYQPDNYFDLLPAGMVDGKQCMLPLAFRISYGRSSPEMLSRRNISLPKGISQSQMFQAFIRSMDAIEENSKDATFMFAFSKATSLITMLDLADLQPINWNNREIFIDRKGLQEVADFSAAIDKDNDRAAEIYHTNQMDWVDCTSQFTLLLTQENLPVSSLYFDNLYQFFLKEHYQAIAFPSYGDSNATCAIISHFGMINANSINPQAAYTLLRLIMDKPIDESYANVYYAPLSINRSNARSLLKWVSNNGFPEPPIIHGQEMKMQPMSQKDADDVKSILDSVKFGLIPNANVDKIINESMQPYIDGAQPFDACADQLEQRLNTYMTEVTSESK